MRLKSLLICGGSLFVSLALIIGIAETGSHPSDAIALESGQPQTMLTAWSTASFPVENFQAYTSPFGYRNSPYGGGRQFHYGLDLAAPSGSYIRNWWTGEVVEVSDNTACGTSIVIQSGDWRHIYCHMQGRVVTQGGRRTIVDRQGGIQISVGHQVVSGTRIGRVGMTGRTTGPHLHWALKYRGSWVDPALVLRAMYNNQAALSP
ncbi:MAG: M23 family metallopeptidase [Cyanobacteria bacterium P01_D01_bin.128]